MLKKVIRNKITQKMLPAAIENKGYANMFMVPSKKATEETDKEDEGFEPNNYEIEPMSISHAGYPPKNY